MIKLDAKARERLEVLEWMQDNLGGAGHEWALEYAQKGNKWWSSYFILGMRSFSEVEKQIAAVERVSGWLFSTEFRGSGRSTLMVLATLRRAMRHPGKAFRLRDHGQSHRTEESVVVPIAKDLAKEIRNLEGREFAFECSASCESARMRLVTCLK